MNKLVFISMLMISIGLNAQTENTDELALKKLNTEIAAAEDRGDRKWLENIMASKLAFRRASGAVVDKDQFLKDVKSREQTTTEIESVKIYGKNRAIVTSVVKMKVDGKPAEFHNLRLFIREGGDWKLLGWANERVTK